MGKVCAHGLCNSNTIYTGQPHMKGVTFIGFPKATTDSAKCLRWVTACNRLNFSESSVSAYTYVCSKHFIGGKGPSLDHPDPVLATASEYPNLNNRTRKRLKPSPALLQEQDGNTDKSLHEYANNCENNFTAVNMKRVKHTSYESAGLAFSKSGNVLSQQGSVVQSQRKVNEHATSATVSFPGLHSERTSSPKCNSDIDCVSPDRCELNRITLQLSTRSLRPSSNNQNGNVLLNTPLLIYNELLSSYHVPTGWAFYYTGNDLVFIKLQDELVILSLKLCEKLNIVVKVCGMELDKVHPICGMLSAKKVSTIKDIFEILETLNHWKVCQGNGDKDFLDLYLRSTLIKDCKLNYQTMSLHSHTCHQLLPNKQSMCVKCSFLKIRLSKTSKRKQIKKKTVFHSNCNFRFLPIKEIRNRMRVKQAKLLSCRKKITRLQKKLQKTIEREGQVIHNDDSQMFEELIQANSSDINAKFYQLFINEQLKALKANGKNGRRWHPEIIQWCLYLKNKSPTTYESIAKCLILPSKRTLYKYSCKEEISGKSGFSPNAIEEMNQLKRSYVREDQKYFIILIDEMKIKEDLVFSNHTGELTGFVSLNETYNHVYQISQVLKRSTSDQQPSLAKQVLQLTLRGISSDFLYPFAYFGSSNTSADVLYSILWEAVEILELNNFRVLGIVGDGASHNRKFFKICCPNSTVPFRTENMFAQDEPRDLFFVSDAPHLIKTSRNSFSNSNFHKKTKHLTRNGQEILWTSIVDLYEEDSQKELRLLQKLLYSHIFLDSYSIMKVKYATQVLSESVATALEMKNDPKLNETVRFLRVFNKFFDLCNVKSLYEGRNKKNDDLCPYTSASDPRLKWLEEDFLDYLTDWENEVASFPKKLTAAERSRMILSRETLEGLKVTALSTVEIVKFMLSKGAPFVLSYHLNQDPLEQYFGQQRAACGSHDNPTLKQYGSNAVKLTFLQGVALEAKKGNITWKKHK